MCSPARLRRGAVPAAMAHIGRHTGLCNLHGALRAGSGAPSRGHLDRSWPAQKSLPFLERIGMHRPGASQNFPTKVVPTSSAVRLLLSIKFCQPVTSSYTVLYSTAGLHLRGFQRVGASGHSSARAFTGTIGNVACNVAPTLLVSAFSSRSTWPSIQPVFAALKHRSGLWSPEKTNSNNEFQSGENAL